MPKIAKSCLSLSKLRSKYLVLVYGVENRVQCFGVIVDTAATRLLGVLVTCNLVT